MCGSLRTCAAAIRSRQHFGPDWLRQRLGTPGRRGRRAWASKKKGSARAKRVRAPVMVGERLGARDERRGTENADCEN